MTRKAPVGRLRRVQLVAEAVSVLCPWCGAAQPNKNGSEMWTREDFIAGSRVDECVSCDERILISSDPKAQFA